VKSKISNSEVVVQSGVCEPQLNRDLVSAAIVAANPNVDTDRARNIIANIEHSRIQIAQGTAEMK
jgi:hypothetical protein